MTEQLKELGELDNYELMKLIRKAKAEGKEEIKFLVNGEEVTLKINKIDPSRVIDREADGW